MIMNSSYLRSSACCCACASRRRVSNCSWLGSRTMGVTMFIGSFLGGFLGVCGSRPRGGPDSVSVSGLRRVDALMRRDAVASHGLPHAELEQLHIQRMQKIGDREHRIRDGDATAI